MRSKPRHLMQREYPEPVDKVAIPAQPVSKPKQLSDKYLIEGLLGDHDTKLKHLECDGFTRVAHYVLKQNGINHRCYQGSCVVGETVVPVHFWIVSGKYTVDYRLQKWAKDAPHGVFDASTLPNVKYEGQQVQLTVSPVTFEILTEG